MPDYRLRQLLGRRFRVTGGLYLGLAQAQAGGEQADPLARYVVDDEFGDLAHKDESFANRLMFWRKNDPSTQTATVRQTAEGQKTIDAATEAERLQALTGGRQAITIQPRRSGGFKLPGL